MTPSLNKSFKFQSEWPYNDSQSYLIQNILNDILNDKEKTIKEEKGEYIITTSVSYSNNLELTHQKIYLDKDKNIKYVEVLNDKEIVKIKMTYNNIDYNIKLKDEEFELTNIIANTDKTSVTMNEIEDTIYPMYLPDNTYLLNEEKVSLDQGERIIMTFDGDNPFTLIEETAKYNDQTEEVYGEIELLTDVFGYISDGMASWVSGGIEYYAVSETMNQDQLLKVINSISTIPVGK